MNSVTIDTKYPRGHTITSRWEKSDYHCPWCGKEDVWEEHYKDDYYTDPTYLCLDCHKNFTMQEQNALDTEYNVRQIAIIATKSER